jgi:ribose 1,5-bisphosphokinase
MSDEGAFAASWHAHGLSYAIPAGVDDELAAGRSVVCNVSRTVVEALRARYANVVVIEVTAPPEVLARRLAARGRAADGDRTERLKRSSQLGSPAADHTISNAGALEPACEAFLRAIVDRSRPIGSRACSKLTDQAGTSS